MAQRDEARRESRAAARALIVHCGHRSGVARAARQPLGLRGRPSAAEPDGAVRAGRGHRPPLPHAKRLVVAAAAAREPSANVFAESDAALRASPLVLREALSTSRGQACACAALPRRRALPLPRRRRRRLQAAAAVSDGAGGHVAQRAQDASAEDVAIEVVAAPSRNVDLVQQLKTRHAQVAAQRRAEPRGVRQSLSMDSPPKAAARSQTFAAGRRANASPQSPQSPTAPAPAPAPAPVGPGHRRVQTHQGFVPPPPKMPPPPSAQRAPFISAASAPAAEHSQHSQQHHPPRAHARYGSVYSQTSSSMGSQGGARVLVDALTVMREGASFLKCGRRGQPHFRHVQLVDGNRVLRWFSSGKSLEETSVPLAQVQQIVLGQTTANFKRVHAPELADVSFSLLYGDGRSLDLVAKDAAEFQIWTQGLAELVKEIRRGDRDVSKLRGLMVQLELSLEAAARQLEAIDEDRKEPASPSASDAAGHAAAAGAAGAAAPPAKPAPPRTPPPPEKRIRVRLQQLRERFAEALRDAEKAAKAARQPAEEREAVGRKCQLVQGQIGALERKPLNDATGEEWEEALVDLTVEVESLEAMVRAAAA